VRPFSFLVLPWKPLQKTDIITALMLTYLPFPTYSRKRSNAPAEVVEAILYKLNTGCQWHWQPVCNLFSGPPLMWQGVCYYFKMRNKQRWLDQSLAFHVSAAPTPARLIQRAAQWELYLSQKYKAARTSNALFLNDNTGQPLVAATPQAGQHYDTFALDWIRFLLNSAPCSKKVTSALRGYSMHSQRL
jgi:hypothetical protein